jgi:hypothetical protein
MKLLIESSDSVSTLYEENGNVKNLYIHGIFMQSNTKNKNGRIYPKQIMENEVSRYNKEFVSTNRAVGELNHPDTPSVNLDKVSHKITELRMDGNNVIGKAQIIETLPMGAIAKGLLEAGVQLGVSSRAVGSCKKVGGLNEVQKDFRLSTIDIVADPSAPEALVTNLYEGAEWIFDNGKYIPIMAEQLKKIKKSKTLSAKQYEIKLYEEFFNLLNANR